MLKIVLLRSKLDKKNKLLEELRKKDEDFQKREQELETAAKEIDENTSDEDCTEIETQVTDFQKEKDEHETEKSGLEEEISKIENKIASEEERQNKFLEAAKQRTKTEGGFEVMANRTKFFGMSIQERDAFFTDEGVKGLLSEVRTCIRERRALTNAGLIIPEIMLDLLKQRVEETSKLIGLVNLRSVSGTTRQRIMGEIPEAIWTEMCASLNELDLSFYDTEVDGFKVGGYFAICNAILEDNDVSLATEIINAIGKAIGNPLIRLWHMGLA